MAKLLVAAPCTSCGKTLPKSAAADSWRGKGVGHVLVESLVEKARTLGVSRVFCLTFEVDFFVRHGFEVMADQSAVDPEVYSELLRSHDEGVAEFLDLARVKPNTLGNTRMIKHL
jgi:amino-acid N-acetyltransferase